MLTADTLRNHPNTTAAEKPCQALFSTKEHFLEPANDNLASDILRGADAIAAFLGFPRRAIYHLVSKGGIPHFRLGETVCARRSTLTEWISEQERAA
ncbi:hypothetical protein EH240_33515 [Mesorhizobium tamadayense]|uniref:DNA-binding protein n=1 Tax=Mesorhizobium tamadayense TaxID=425306 RepID=A0A3P3EUI2_9HYPH|nr:excisionase family DNA-binding protein [Mesorhizobium tamadayense]RRH90049.1 hypothetical protein EH240_33515 [Mesorhizobium tamadayense]